MSDIFNQARSYLRPSLIEHYFGVSGAYWEKGEFHTLNPLRPDNNIGSFSISEGGLYKDFASKEKGDFIDLLSKRDNLSLRETAEKIINDSGGTVENDNKSESGKSKKQEKSKKSDYKKKQKTPLKPAIYPIPDTELEGLQKFAHSEYFKTAKSGPSWSLKKLYIYKNYDNDTIFFVGRYERPNQKNPDEKPNKKFIPFWLQEGPKWRAVRPEQFMPFPLYGINRIFDNDDTVIIVSGEECIKPEIEDYNIVSYQGGDNRVIETDWDILKDRKVLIWPDNDNPGLEAANQIRNDFLPHAEILDISDQKKPKGWDIKNASDEGIDLLKFINECPRFTEDNYIPLDPFYAYKHYIQDMYDNENLQQIDGIFWRYLKNKHYWENIDISNLKSDFQIWMQKSGLIEMLHNEERAKRSFQSQAEGFINNHSLGYYEENPFRNSAINPFIHLKNGAIEMYDNGYKFHSREEQGEEFFKQLYPITCFDYDYNEDLDNEINYDNISDHAPLFSYVIDHIIPDHAKNNEKERVNTIKFICQIIAYAMNPIKPRDYFFAFYGNQGTSKTLLYKIVRLFIGRKFAVYRDVNEMEGNRFAASDLWGSKIFVDDDLGEKVPLPDSFIKKYSGNQEITVENKFKAAQHGIKISITMFFISNYEFKITGTEGIKRRAIIVKFSNTVNENKMDKFIPERISGEKPHDKKTPECSGETFDERPFIFNLILKSWEEFKNDNNIFTVPEWVKGPAAELLETMTAVGSFIRECINGENEYAIMGTKYSRDEIYKNYCDWCKDQGRKSRGKGKFIEELKRSSHIKYNRQSDTRTWQIVDDVDEAEEKEFDKELADNVF